MSWTKIAAITRKDLGLFFVSPMGYVVMAIFYLVSGYFFWLVAVVGRAAVLSFVFQNTIVLLLFLAPLITMRIWAEEEKSGTAELLRTSPLTLWEIVIGKYLALVGFFGALLLSTVVYLVIMMSAGNPDLGPVLANYLGYILTGMSFLALGLLASTVSENQIIAAVLTYGMLLMLWVIGAAADNIQGPVGEFLGSISIFAHLNDFMSGVVDLTHVVYFASLIFIGLFFAVKVLEGKRS
jgi:ABC-2 type transport system permease protein